MKKGALPIPYIIALILGVIVVGVLAYWFISTAIKGGKTGESAECTAKRVEFCTTQSQSTLEKVREVCKEIPDWCDFCKLIPNWKPLTGECPKK